MIVNAGSITPSVLRDMKTFFVMAPLVVIEVGSVHGSTPFNVWFVRAYLNWGYVNPWKLSEGGLTNMQSANSGQASRVQGSLD